MAKKSNWRFYLFVAGAAITCAIAIAEIALIALGKIGDISWVIAALLAFGALLPTALFGAPYINSKFYIAYSKETGLKIGEERRKSPRKGKTKEPNEAAEWASDDDFALPTKTQNNFIACKGCQ